MCMVAETSTKPKHAKEDKVTDTTHLKAVIADKGLKLTYIADELGITYAALNKKLNGETEFKAPEMSKLRTVLRLSDEELIEIFFTQKVAETAT